MAGQLSSMLPPANPNLCGESLQLALLPPQKGGNLDSAGCVTALSHVLQLGEPIYQTVWPFVRQ